MPKAVLITSHFWNSKRRAGFHNIADSLLKKGYEVLFLTGNASFIHHLKSDYRASLINKAKLNKFINEQNGMNQFIRFTTLHPVNYRSKIINKMLLQSVKKYSDALKGIVEVNDFIKDSELFIFESFPGLLWFDHFKNLNNSAKYVYRVSDDLRHLRKHPYIIEHEEKISSKFDLISVPSEYIYNLFKGRGHVVMQHHGVRKDLFDKDFETPFGNKDSFKFVFTGNAYLDKNFLRIASELFPKDEFHVLGPFQKRGLSENVKFYGEINFDETIPFVKFADAGLHTLKYTKGSESFSDSLKIMQYTYCRLPILAPEIIKSERNNFIFYIPDNKNSIKKAVSAAKEFDRNSIDTRKISSWDDLTEKIITE